MRIRLHFLFGFSLSTAAAVSAGCTTKTTDPYPDVATFCASVAKAECQVASTCAIDETSCEQVRAASCNTRAAMAMGSGVRKYTETNVQPCLDALNGAYGGGASQVTFAKLLGKGSISDSCERVFVGSAATLAPCTSPYDCANGDLCVPPTPIATSSFVCAPEVDKQVDGLCGDPGSVCQGDSYCSSQANGLFQCVASAQTGQACSASAPVVACVDTARCTGGTCEERVKAGERCSSNDDCPASAPYCDGNAGSVCTLGLTFATHAPDCVPFEPGVVSVVDSGVNVGVPTDAAATSD